MSIFCVGGPKDIIVPLCDINTTEEDRYFLPGTIHGGEDYIIQVYGYNVGDGSPEGERIEAKYLYAVALLAWAKEATKEDGSLDMDMFEELLCENSEGFIIDNDGSGDFFTLNNLWDEARAWSYQDIISWAQLQVNKERGESARHSEKSIGSLEEKIQSATKACEGLNKDKKMKEVTLEIEK